MFKNCPQKQNDNSLGHKIINFSNETKLPSFHSNLGGSFHRDAAAMTAMIALTTSHEA